MIFILRYTNLFIIIEHAGDRKHRQWEARSYRRSNARCGYRSPQPKYIVGLEYNYICNFIFFIKNEFLYHCGANFII